MPRHVSADQSIHDLLREVMDAHHTDLAEAGVTVGILMAYATSPDTPALKHHGYPALAIIRICPARDRVAGMADAMLLLDAEEWPERTDEERHALVDHELEHLVVVRDDKGKVKTDDAGRPKLKMRMHSFQIGGFWSVVDRHGANAPESRAYRDVHHGFSQRTFPWG